MHLRSSPGGGLLDPATPAIIRRSQRIVERVMSPEKKNLGQFSKPCLRKVYPVSKPKPETSVHVTGRRELDSDSNFRKRKLPDANPTTAKSMKQDVGHTPANLDCHFKVPVDSQFRHLFSNFFNKCFQCDEEYLCHIRLKLLNSEKDNYKSEEFVQRVANESVDFLRERLSIGACSHNLSLESANTNSNQSEDCLESLVKVEILEGDNLELKSFDVIEPPSSRTTPHSSLFSSNYTPAGNLSYSAPEIGDVEVIGLGEAVGTSITFNFIINSQKAPVSEVLIERQGTAPRIIKRRPGRRQAPPRIIPTVINGVNIADFKAKLDNLRMCGICCYNANGMVDLNMHQLVAHSLGKNGGRRPEWSHRLNNLSNN